MGADGNRNDWYQRWIDGIANDVADNMEGEPERQARMDDLHDRLDQLRGRLKQLKPKHRGHGPHVDATRDAGQRGDDDSRIRSELNARLTDDLYLDATGIAVGVNGGYVTLTGTVDSRAAKRLAEDCADCVAGVRDINNTLRIRPIGD